MAQSNTKKILFTSHTANFSKFNRPFTQWLKKQGYIVHYASAGEEKVLDCDKHFKIPFARNPFTFSNIQAYKQLKAIIDTEGYDLIHTHTPMGSVITRLAARKARKNGTRVIYTAHGFHFFKGAPLLNWLTYYPVEKWMSKYTDTLVTINQEDFDRARANFHSKRILKINGVGVDLETFKPVSAKQKNDLRKRYGFGKNDLILIYAAELNANKNQDFLIRQMHDLQKDIPNIKLLLCGIGDLHDDYARTISNLHLENVITLMGYRSDMNQLFQISDISVASSIREGLGVNLIEAMATGLPVIASNNRGHREVINHGVNGYLYRINDADSFKDYISSLHANHALIKRMGKKNTTDTSAYSLQNVISYMEIIYAPSVKQHPTTKKHLTVSVIIPAYNASNKIRRTLDSVINQTAITSIKEIIVINDGSTDKTKEVVEEYVSKYSKKVEIRLATTKNKGVSSARNLGLKMVRSDWVALLDSDDYWATDKIQKQIEAIKSNPDIKFIGSNSTKRILRYGFKVSENLYRINLRQYLFKTFPSTCSILFHKDILRTTGYFDDTQHYAEDANLFMKMIHLYDGYYLVDPLLILDDKHTFGDTGLSSKLREMHRGCLKNIDDAYKLRFITAPTRAQLVAWEYIRYLRRIILTNLRRSLNHVRKLVG